MARNSTTGGQHNFARIPNSSVPRSTFNRSCGVKTTFDFGELIPIFVDEALPGDTMQMTATMFGRLATQLKPVMDNMFMDVHFWYVPYRIIWDNWQGFMGERVNPDDDPTGFLIPEVTVPPSVGFGQGSLYDYLGVPPDIPHGEVTNLQARAYNKIWAEWYRDENLQDSPVLDTDDGPDTDTDYIIRKRGKRHDYFTSCLPWPQKGPSIELPLGTSAPVTLLGDADVIDAGTAPTWDMQGNTYTIGKGTGSTAAVWSGSSGNDASATWVNTGLKADTTAITGSADLQNATAATINQLRQSIAFQRLYEKDARGGSRYKEILHSHFGQTGFNDARLQRPEYLGGGTVNLNVNTVAQQSGYGQNEAEFMGDLAAYTTASGQMGFRRTLPEHGVIMGIVSCRADLNYQQGLDKQFSRRERTDFYFPELSAIGEQAVLNKEIYADASATDDQVFGYQARFSEYRYKPSITTSKMRSNATLPLDIWHLGQDFATLPVLGDTFIQENPPISRIVAVPSEPDMILDGFFSYKCTRPIPQYGVPGLTRL